MKKRILGAVLLAAIAQPVAAEVYVGAKLGYLMPNEDGADSAAGASLTVGYEFADVLVADLGLEAEYTTNIDDGSVDVPGGSVDYDYSSLGLLAAVRTAGPVYLRGRAGVVRQEYDVVGAGSDDDTTGAIGIGVGFSLLGLESSLDWTRYLDADNFDATDYVSLGMRF